MSNIECSMSRERLVVPHFIIRYSLFDIHHSIWNFSSAAALNKEDPMSKAEEHP